MHGATMKTPYYPSVKSLHFILVLDLLELCTKFLNIITFKSRYNAAKFLCSCSKESERTAKTEASSILKLDTTLSCEAILV